MEVRASIALAALCCAGGLVVSMPGPAGAATTGDWSTFHGDALHDGVSPDTTIGASHAPQLAVKWSHTLDGSPVFASPMVAYNATDATNLLYEVTVAGTVEAMDASNGAEVWTKQVGAGVLDSPAIDANSLYVGTDGGLLTALDATTGAVQCTYQLPILAPETTPGRIEASPVVGHDGTGSIVYFGDTGQSESVNRGREWAINGFGNTAGSCTPKWMHDLGSSPRSKHSGSWSPPALVVDSTGRTLVVFGTGQPDDAVYALDASNGSQVWRFQTLTNFSDADVGAGPTISAPGVNGIADGAVYIDGKDRVEYAIDLLSGAQLWEFDMGADAADKVNSVSCASLVGNMVVVTYSTYVYEFNATTGAKLWRSVAMSGNTLGSVIVSGAPGDQVVLIADLTGRIYAFRLSDGAELTSVRIAQVKSSASKIAASIAISDGMAFVAGENGTVYGLG
jgi:outer membrane protein assembly factor BamB